MASGIGKPKKNSRILLLCINCKARKIKCNRQNPCDACIRRNVAHECLYSVKANELLDLASFSGMGIFRTFSAVPRKPLVSKLTENGNAFKVWQVAPSEPSSHLSGSRLSDTQTHSGLQSNVTQLTQSPLSTPPSTQRPLLLPEQGPPAIRPSVEFKQEIKCLGINPYDEDDPDELLDLYSGYVSFHLKGEQRRMNYGPFAWIALLKKDRVLRPVWKYLQRERDAMFGAPSCIEDRVREEEPQEEEYEAKFRKKALAGDGGNDMEPLKESGNSDTDRRIQMNKHALALGLTFFEGEMDQKLHLIEKIKMVLPTRKCILLLVNKFFHTIYPFMPFIDESWFRGEINRLIGPDSYLDEKVSDIAIERRVDLATLGILLISLRLSYLSAFSNQRLVNEQIIARPTSAQDTETKYILTHPIDIDVVDLAKLCLEQFDLYRRTNLAVLQCAIFMRVYHVFAPEDGDGADGGVSHVFNSMCVQIAYSMGINREPTVLEGVCNDERVNNICRKIWFYLKVLDTSQAYQYGFPLLIDEDYADTLLPFYKPGGSNLLDVNMESFVCEHLHNSSALAHELRQILKVTLRMKNFAKMKDVTDMFSKFEVHLATVMGSLPDYTKTPAHDDTYLFLKIMKCKTYMNYKSFLMTIYFHFFLNYEKRNKTLLAFFYLRKVMTISCGEFLPEFLELIRNNKRNFDKNSTVPELILNPSLEYIIHKSNQMHISILVRLNYTVAEMELKSEKHNQQLRLSAEYRLYYGKLMKLSKIIEKLIRFGSACLARLSHRYYYAWRVSKAHTFMVDLLSKKSFYQATGVETEGEHFLKLDNHQLNELLDIADNTMWRIKSVTKADMNSAAAQTLETPMLDPLPLDLPQFTTEQAAPGTGLSESDDFEGQIDSQIDNLWLNYETLRNEEAQPVSAPENDQGSLMTESMPFDMQTPLSFTPSMQMNDFDDIFNMFRNASFQP